MAEDRSAAPPSRTATGPLHAELRGVGPTLVLAHGFTQTSRTWGTFADDLATDHRLVLIDLPGHGGSAGTAADLPTGAELLVETAGAGCYLGYSMGARLCLHAALARPESVGALVLVSGTAGIDDREERRARLAADQALADRLDPGEEGAPALSVESFLEHWLAQPMFAGLDPAAAAIEERARNTPVGLASSLRLAGTGTQEPLWDRLPGLEMPVLILTGATDAKFTALGSRMARSIGRNASAVAVPGAGHAPQLDRPAEVARLVRRFIGATA